MINNNILKTEFRKKFDEVLYNNTSLRHLLYEIFVFGSAYIVGGYLRDIINNKKSRDIDIIVDLNHNDLLEIISKSKIEYIINRHNGIKLVLLDIEIDIWSIENNWAFKNDLVKLNEDDKLNSIAKGCFYNYDALVINLHNFNFNIKYYRDFKKTNQLDILQTTPSYKNLNPTIEANILRAFYLRKINNISYSINTKKYLINKIGYLKDKHGNPNIILLNTKSKYPKYDSVLNVLDIDIFITELIIDNELNDQLFLNL